MAQRVNERTTLRYQATLKDETGAAVPSASLTSIKLTLYVIATGAIINSRSAQEVKNANGGTFGATDGLFTMKFSDLDNVLLDATLSEERHRAVFDATWSAGRATWFEDITVENIPQIT